MFMGTDYSLISPMKEFQLPNMGHLLHSISSPLRPSMHYRVGQDMSQCNSNSTQSYSSLSTEEIFAIL